MNIVITGASGFIGRNIRAVLERAHHSVVPISRHHGVDVSCMHAPEHWMGYLKHIDAVINCVGIIGQTRSQRFDQLHAQVPMALFRACLEVGVRRVVQISALGSDDKAFSTFHLSKRQADQALLDLDIEGFILRPSLVYGLGGRSHTLFMRLARLPRLVVLEGGQQIIQPVHIYDVVSSVLSALSADSGGAVIDVVGPEIMTFEQWLQRLRLAQGLDRGKLLPVSMGVAKLLAGVGGFFSPMSRVENLRMLQGASEAADLGPLENLLGRSPLGFTPELMSSDALFSYNEP